MTAISGFRGWGYPLRGDAEHYNYFRDYDPAIGRYVQSDPIGLQAGLDTFGYAINDPIGIVDSTGLLPDDCLACIVYAEAGGTSDDCQQGVAAVVMNRMGDLRHFPGQSSPCLVVSAKNSRGSYEFNAFNGDRYNRCKSRCQTARERYSADKSFFNSAGPFSDNTNKSTYFHDKTIPMPKWIRLKIKRGEMSEQRVQGCSSLRFYRIK